MEKKYADINTLSRFLYNLKKTFSLLTHTHTKAEIGLGNVDNKSSATIRGEITTANVVNALGYTPLNKNDVIDPTTATVEGFAADAKLTGDAISELNKKIPSSIFECNGQLFNGTGLPISGYGHATVIIFGKIARIDFSLKIENKEETSDSIFYGINYNLLKIKNANLPNITPIVGGQMNIFDSNGVIRTVLTGYGGLFISNNQFWVPARIYTTEGAIGSWPARVYDVGDTITGTCYGAVS